MKEKFEDWKEDIENRASKVVETSEDQIDTAMYDAAVQMGDAENIIIGERPIGVTIKQLEAEGWHYLGPVSAESVLEVATEEAREIKIVGTGAQRFVFERDKRFH